MTQQSGPAVIRQAAGLDHVFLNIQQHSCGQPEEFINKHSKPCRWPGRLRHVMSEAHRLLHSGCLWVRFKSSLSPTQSRPAAFFIFCNRGFIKDATCRLHGPPRPDPGRGMDCSPSVVSIMEPEMRSQRHRVYRFRSQGGCGADHIRRWLLIRFSIPDETKERRKIQYVFLCLVHSHGVMFPWLFPGFMLSKGILSTTAAIMAMLLTWWHLFFNLPLKSGWDDCTMYKHPCLCLLTLQVSLWFGRNV